MKQRPNSIAARDIASLLHPQTNLRQHLAKGPELTHRGSGVHVYDDQGSAFIDASSGLWCASLGFAVERLAKVAYEQMSQLSYSHLYRHRSHEAAIELAERLLDIAPVPMSKVLFQCSGSEANDVAIKLVWYYHNAIGKPEKRKIIARHMGYHGSTVAAVSLSGKPDMHADFNLPLDGFLHTDWPHYYRFGRNGESEDEYSTRLAERLEQMILAEGPETIGAFFAEPVMGAAGGVLPPSGYFEKVQSVLRQYDILFVADEVICGFGRTGRMWGSETFGIVPDMLTSAKALSAAALPISAVMVNDKIFQAMLSESDKLGSFAHGFTYAGHPVSAAVALETLKIYDEIDLLERARENGERLSHALAPVAQHPLVGDISQAGMLAGIELVSNKTTRQSFDTEVEIATRVASASQRHGLIHRAMGQRVAFAPPFVISEVEMRQVGERFLSALDEVWSEVQLH
ncbi:MAG: aminotransferase [Pseudomonadota bacterium]|nr:aminotransferase [Pseudomonadota bacterium]